MNSPLNYEHLGNSLRNQSNACEVKELLFEALFNKNINLNLFNTDILDNYMYLYYKMIIKLWLEYI